MKKAFSIILTVAFITALLPALFSCKKEKDDPLAHLDDTTETVAELKAVMAELGYEINKDNFKEYFTSRLQDLVNLGAEFAEEEMTAGYAIIFTHPDKSHVSVLCFDTRALARRYSEAYANAYNDYTRCARREGGVVIIGNSEDVANIKF